jgi:ribosomal protein S18 acetylase RimI-like enzyme
LLVRSNFLTLEHMARIVTHYLELTSRELFRPALVVDPDLQVIEHGEPLPAFCRTLWLAIGQEIDWDERVSWSDETWRCHLNLSTTTVLVLYRRGTPAGFIELNAASSEPGTEISYFGLFREWRARGLGKHLLSMGVQRAFDDGATRVWLHTDNFDGPHALANYQARGFQIYRTTVHEEILASERGD